MAKSFLTATMNFDDFANVTSGEINSYVLKNNETVLRKIYTYFQSDNNILLLNGFAGTGKKQIAEHIISYMDKETIVCKYVCMESTKLDDIELGIYKTLKKKLAATNELELEAINSIKDKINFILSKYPLKYVFAFYNFDYLSKENRTEILNYIYTFTDNENIKTLIVSRTFDTDEIPEETKYTKLMVKALTKDMIENYLREFGVNSTPAMLEQFYRLTRGYFFYACLAAKIMVNQEMSVNNFIIQYSNSGLKFDEYLAKKYYSLIIGTTKSAFNMFVKLRHGLNIALLQSLGSYPEKILKTLADNYYIYKRGDLYYPSNFLKQYLEEGIDYEVSRERLAKYYEKQLELSPEERDINISRATMLEEIAFYKNIQIEPEEEVPEAQEEIIQETPLPPIKENSIPEEYFTIGIDELLNKARELFREFKYLNTLDALSVLLSRQTENKNQEILNQAHDMLAKTYAKLAKWKYALYYYNILEDFYKKENNIEKLHNIKFEIANIYYQSYRTLDAMKLLKELLAETDDNQIKAGSNILLGNIALSSSNKKLALRYYKDGITEIDAGTNPATAIELFFKFAILSDENNDINNAVEFYQKCIEINDTSNKYTALAYSNLADLFFDNELLEEAKECFEKSYNLDKLNNNEYGMYYSTMKLVELTNTKDKEKRLELSKEAKQHATNCGDSHAIIDSTIKLGDIYFDCSKPENALTEYLELYRTYKDKFNNYNLNMLKKRMEDVKARLGKEKFEELVPDYE